MSEVRPEKPCAAGIAEAAARHARMCILAEEAMADSGFVADLHETMQVFQHMDKENWPLYDQPPNQSRPE